MPGTSHITVKKHHDIQRCLSGQLLLNNILPHHILCCRQKPGDLQYVDYRDSKFKLNASSQQKSHSINRFLMSMRTLYLTGAQQTRDLDHQRWMFENTPQYETGYIIGEILERYKKMIENCRMASVGVWKSSMNHNTKHFHAQLRRVELVQKLYFEIYHLVRMVHEVIPKYEHEPEVLKELFVNPNSAGAKLNPDILDKARLKHNFDEHGLNAGPPANPNLHARGTKKERESAQRKKVRMQENIIKYLSKDPIAMQKYVQALSKSMGEYKPKKIKRWPLEYGHEIEWYF